MSVTVTKLRITCTILLAAIAVVAAAALTVGRGEEEMPPPLVEPVAPPEAEASGGVRSASRHELRLPPGNAVVWVRRDQRIDLYDEPGGEVLETLGQETEFGSRTVLYVDHHRDGWAAVPTAFFDNGRLAWVRLDSRRLGATRIPWEIQVDLSDYQATLFANGRRVRTFSVSIGKPGAETPTGRFAVTDTFRGNLNPAYGCCAVALTARQTRLPSGWLGGDRIAIHGTSGPLGAAISHGCIRARDADVSLLVDKVPVGTPVVIRR